MGDAVVDTGGTILPRASLLTGSRRERILDQLLDGGRISTAERRLELQDVIGQGGMGIVHRGRQASLDREVAVKGVRPDKRSADATLKLLQEAWIAGNLEHPNIIPIYDIGVDDRGEPLIVQKRVEGTAWSAVAWEPDAIRTRFGAEDPLEWNLRVLMQVCNALHYAHERGIVHLDIKPANVMVGPYGEVLLLDWGLAMALEDDGSGRLPLVSENEDVIGTPGYMAPEMLSQGDVPLTARTDVYLVGATLYALLTGSPPHQGSTALAMMFAAATRAPAPVTEGPPELIAVIEKAIATDAADRYASAEELRLALEGFLRTRDAARLVTEAQTRTDELLPLLGDDDADDARIQDLFSAARFGFEQALAIWSGSERAEAGRARLIEHMARYELGRDNAQSARDLLVSLPSPPADLLAAAEARRAELAALGARVEELEQAAAFHDPARGQRTRAFVVFVLGVLFVALPIWRILEPPDELRTFQLGLATPLFYLGVLAAVALWGRESLFMTAVNRKTLLHILVFIVAQAFLTMVANRLGIDTEDALPLLMILWATTAALFAVHLESRIWPLMMAYLLAALGSLTWPEWQWHFTAAANAVFLVNGLWVWWPRPFWRPRP